MKVRTFKPFDVEKAKNGAKVLTRDGHEVRILSYNIKTKYSPILAVISGDDEEEEVMQYNEEGEPDEADREELWLHIIEEVETKSEDEEVLKSIQEYLTLFFKSRKSDKKGISKEDIFKWIENKKNTRKECINEDETWYIARDKDGTLCIYSDEPERDDESFDTDYMIGNCTILNDDIFPEVTWQGGPKKIKVNIELISDEDEENN